MRLILLLLLIFPCVSLQAQTDIISFKSHSGKMIGYTTHSSAGIDGITTNFGMDPYRQVKTAALDTIRFLSNGTAVMVTSEYCRREMYGEETELDVCLPRSAYGHLWQAGTDTMENHPLFKRNHSLDSIKEVLKSTYNFQNSIDSVVFVGYDNVELELRDEKFKHQKSIKEGRVRVNSKKSGFGLTLLMTILLPVLLIYVFSPFIFKSRSN